MRINTSVNTTKNNCLWLAPIAELTANWCIFSATRETNKLTILVKAISNK